WFTTWWRGSRALCDGRFDEAERLRETALAMGQRIQHPGAMAISQGQAIWLRAGAGGAPPSFGALAAHDFADIPRDEHWLVTLTTLARACAPLGDRRRAGILYEMLRPFAQRNVVHDLLRTYSGSVSQYLGLLSQAMGKLDRAAGHFEDALAMNTRIGGRPFLVRTQYEY